MKRALLTFLAAALALSAGAGPLRAADTTVTISQGVDADTLNPLATTITPTFNVVQQVYERLADYGSKAGEYEPRLAVSWRRTNPDHRGVQAAPRRDVLQRRPLHVGRRQVHGRLDQEPGQRLQADAVRARHRPGRDARPVHGAADLEGADRDPARLAAADLHRRRQVLPGQGQRLRRRAPGRHRRLHPARVEARRGGQLRRQPQVVERPAQDRSRRVQADPRGRARASPRSRPARPT